MPFRVCLLGVLTLIISWGSLGLELAAAAVSVAMATSPSSLTLQWCNLLPNCLSECVQCGYYCSLMCHVCFTLSQSASDFCVSPDTYITRVTKENAVINQGLQTKAVIFNTFCARYSVSKPLITKKQCLHVNTSHRLKMSLCCEQFSQRPHFPLRIVLFEYF